MRPFPSGSGAVSTVGLAATVTDAGELVAANVAAAPAARPAPAGKVAAWQAELAEAFRSVRTRLLLAARQGDHSFLITSATPSEGKSTVAANVATALASVGRTVLLVDADLRRPRAHAFFDLPNREGLTDVLTGARAISDVWQTLPGGLTVLASGPRVDDPQYWLQTEAFAAAIVAARRYFEFILVDTAPILAVPDACLLAAQVDATILVVKYAAVSEKEALEAIDRLRAAKARVIGSVLTQMTQAADPYHAYGSAYVNTTR